MVWWPFATKPERAATLEVTDLHSVAPPLYSTRSFENSGPEGHRSIQTEPLDCVVPAWSAGTQVDMDVSGRLLRTWVPAIHAGMTVLSEPLWSLCVLSFEKHRTGGPWGGHFHVLVGAQPMAHFVVKEFVTSTLEPMIAPLPGRLRAGGGQAGRLRPKSARVGPAREGLLASRKARWESRPPTRNSSV